MAKKKEKPAKPPKPKKVTLESLDAKLSQLVEWTSEVLESVRKKPRAKYLKILNELGDEVMTFTISPDKKRTFRLAIKAANGKPAPIDGVPTWEISPTGPVSLFPASDGMTCEIAWLKDGLTTLTVTADADLGTGVKTISNTAEIEALTLEASSIEISADDEVDQ